MQSSQIMFGFVTSFLDAPSGTAQTQMTPSDSPPLTMAPAVPLKCFNRPGGENLRAPTAPWCAPADTTRVTRMQSKSIDFAIFRLQARVCGAHMREQGAAREDFCFEVVGSHTLNFGFVSYAGAGSCQGRLWCCFTLPSVRLLPEGASAGPCTPTIPLRPSWTESPCCSCCCCCCCCCSCAPRPSKRRIKRLKTCIALLVSVSSGSGGSNVISMAAGPVLCTLTLPLLSPRLSHTTEIFLSTAVVRTRPATKGNTWVTSEKPH